MPHVEYVCPRCEAERADYEGPDGARLPTCPNCGSDADPVERATSWGDLVSAFVLRAIEETDPLRRAVALKNVATIIDQALEEIRGEIPTEIDDLV